MILKLTNLLVINRQLAICYPIQKGEKEFINVSHLFVYITKLGLIKGWVSICFHYCVRLHRPFNEPLCSVFKHIYQPRKQFNYQVIPCTLHNQTIFI